MNILILNWRDPLNPQAGGAEKVTEKYALALIDQGHRVDWLSTTYYKGSKNQTINGIRYFRRGGVFTQFLLFPLFYFLHRKEYDLVIDQIHGIPYMTPLFVRRKKVAFIHEVAGDVWDKMFPFPINVLGKYFERFCYLFYKNIPFITVSNSTQKELTSLGIKDVIVVHSGIDKVTLQPYKKEKNPTFIYVSRLVKMKGIEDVLRSFTIIHKKIPSASLWIVGKGNKTYESYLKQLSKKLAIDSSIHFYVNISDEEKYSFMRKAHLLLHASVKEGWGLVVLEAATQETPSIVYNVSGLRNSVQHNKTGIVLTSNTPKAMADEVIALMNDEKRLSELSSRAYEWAMTFSWREATKKYIHRIESL